jgi:hypothetical protein
MLTNISSKKEQRSRRIVILLGCLIILGLSSCLQSNTKLNPTVTPLSTTIPTSTFVLPTTTLPPPVEPSLTSTPTSIATSSPPAILVSTLRAYPTRIGVGEYPGQVTDGILLFSVEKVTDRCYKSLEAIKLKFIFKNLTDKAIKIPNDFSIALDRNGNGGSLLPYITSAEGLDLLSDADILAISIFSPPSDRYLTLLGNQEFETVLIYGFPEFVTRPNQRPLVTPSPGHYFLKFVFAGYGGDIDIWSGLIESNRIEICLIN